MAIKRTYYIDAPVEATWEVMTKIDDSVASDLMHVYDVHETKDGVGTNFSWDMKIAGRKIFSGFDVYTEVVPYERLVERSAGLMPGTWVTTFAAAGKGTNVTMEIHPGGLWRYPPLVQLGKLMLAGRGRQFMPLMEKKAQEIARKTAEREAHKTPRPRKTAAAH